MINEDYLKEEGQALQKQIPLPRGLSFGLLLGGNTKAFSLNAAVVAQVLSQIKRSVEKHEAKILASTSRRTPAGIENLLKQELKNYPRCGILVVASENNPSFAVGGILDLSKIIIVSPESISMISEAATCGKYIVVFKARVGQRHAQFLGHLAAKNYIYLCRPDEISSLIDEILRKQPPIRILEDNLKVTEALRRII